MDPYYSTIAEPYESGIGGRTVLTEISNDTPNIQLLPN